MTKWNYLIEAQDRVDILRRRAIASGADSDWDAYEGLLLRTRGITRAMETLATRASFDRMDLVRKLIDNVPLLPDGKVVLLTGFRPGSAISSGRTPPRETWIVYSATGNRLRARLLRSQSMLYTHWSMPLNLSRDDVIEPRFYIADVRQEHLPADHPARTDQA